MSFQNDSELLINLPAAQMSLNLDNHREFYEWYEKHLHLIFKPGILPRFIFGHYMKDYLQKFNHKYGNINIIKEEVNEVFIESEIGKTKVTYCVSKK